MHMLLYGIGSNKSCCEGDHAMNKCIWSTSSVMKSHNMLKDIDSWHVIFLSSILVTLRMIAERATVATENKIW